MATKKAEIRTHNPIPFAKIAKMYTEGKTMQQIAKAVNRFNEKSPDPTKPVRAIISGMMTKGYKGENGKTITLKKRLRTAASEARKPTGKASAPRVKGKAVPKATKGTKGKSTQAPPEPATV